MIASYTPEPIPPGIENVILNSPLLTSSQSEPREYLSAGRGFPSGPGGRGEGTSRNRDTDVLFPIIVEFRSKSMMDPETHVVLPIGTHSAPSEIFGVALP